MDFVLKNEKQEKINLQLKYYDSFLFFLYILNINWINL
jgi:hypothetical protein